MILIVLNDTDVVQVFFGAVGLFVIVTTALCCIGDDNVYEV